MTTLLKKNGSVAQVTFNGYFKTSNKKTKSLVFKTLTKKHVNKQLCKLCTGYVRKDLLILNLFFPFKIWYITYFLLVGSFFFSFCNTFISNFAASLYFCMFFIIFIAITSSCFL